MTYELNLSIKTDIEDSTVVKKALKEKLNEDRWDVSIDRMVPVELS